MLAITNAIIVMENHYIYDGIILIEDGKIVDFGRKLAIPEGAEILDANGAYVGPGLIDIHTRRRRDLLPGGSRKGGENVARTRRNRRASRTLLQHKCGSVR